MKTADKIVVGSYFPVPELPSPDAWGWKYSFTTSAEVPQDKWQEIIAAIEEVLNKKIKELK